MQSTDNSLEYCFHCIFLCLFFFPEKIRLDISCESSARQRIHVKHQALFSLKDKNKKKNKSVSCLLQVFFALLGLKWILAANFGILENCLRT